MRSCAHVERLGAGPHRHDAREELDRCDGDIFELERHRRNGFGEKRERCLIVVGGDRVLGRDIERRASASGA